MVPLEVRGVLTRVATAMLWQEHAVGSLGPAGTSSAYVLRSEPRWEPSLAPGSSDIFDEAAHH
jgi:hypothetical protein